MASRAADGEASRSRTRDRERPRRREERTSPPLSTRSRAALSAVLSWGRTGGALKLGMAAVSKGGADVTVTGVDPIDEAEEGRLAFLGSPRYARHLEGCRAVAFLVASDLADLVERLSQKD